MVAQISGVSLAMTDTMEVEAEWPFSELFALLLCQKACFFHLHQHDIATLDATFRITDRVIEAGVLAHPHEQGTLASVHSHRLLAEVGLGGSLDAYGIMQEVEVVEVHVDDFLLRVETLQLEGNDPLDGFL